MSFSIYVNNKQVTVSSNMSILQACEIAGIVVPRFCYHERLSIAGNCRMCLVEVEKMPKLQASCAVPVSPNMAIKTNSLAVKKAREGVLEFLLVNHPLDCPICDQGGECDLQDQSMVYGSDRSRFKDSKRAVEDKFCGPLIKTIMTRCIHCTRCVRFANEVAGIPDLGTSGRGNLIEIGTYIEKVFSSELSGNVIDLCPVGALTSKPYSFLARPWELKSIESIDLFDSIQSNIRVDARGYEIMRVLPRLNEFINDEWITDKARFAFDGLSRQRLNKPLIKKNNSFQEITWSKAIDCISDKIKKINKPRRLGISFSNFIDLDSLIYAKTLLNKYNGVAFSENNEESLDIDYQSFYKFNSNLSNIHNSNICLIIGANPKTEGAILNYHLRKRYLNGNFVLAYIGSYINFSFPVLHLGTTLDKLIKIIEGKSFFCKYLKNSKNPSIIVGKSLINDLKNNDLKSVLKYFKENTNLITDRWNGLNIFNVKSSDYFRLELGINCMNPPNQLDVLYIMGNTKIKLNNTSSCYIVYQGHHGCELAQKADVILPILTFMEKPSIYGNIEGKIQSTQCVSLPVGESREEWKVIYAIYTNSIVSGFSNINASSLDKNKLLDNMIPYFSIDQLSNKNIKNFFKFSSFFFSFANINNTYLYSGLFDNFYKTDIISECSLNMSKCTLQLLDKTPFKL